MTDSPAAADAASLTDPGPPPPRPPGAPSGGHRFFAWLRGLGIVRGDGWVGGVCAGLAARIGIDPVIVRGVFVVGALFALPMFLIYAIGWALLPDATGRIHLQEALRRRFDPATVAIGILLLVSIFPLVPWFFSIVLPFGYLVPFGGPEWSPLSVLGTIIGAVLVIALVFLLVRSSRRTAPTGVVSAPDPRTASADPAAPLAVDDSGVDAPADPARDAFASAAGSALLSPPPPVPPTPLATGASDAELAAWRAQHDAWRAQDDAWRRHQKDAETAAREQARAERAAANAAFASEAAERRRIRRLTRPRTSPAFVALVSGAAMIAGAATALGVGAAQGDTLVAVAAGLLAAALTVAMGMVLAGALRRRSGFLAFVTVALLIAGTATAAPAVTSGIAFGSAYVNNIEPQSFTQVWGDLTIDLLPPDDPEPIEIVKRGGSTTIRIDADMVVRLEIRGVDTVSWTSYAADDWEYLDDGEWSASTGANGDLVLFRSIDTTEAATRGVEAQIVRLDQSGGSVYVEIREPRRETP